MTRKTSHFKTLLTVTALGLGVGACGNESSTEKVGEIHPAIAALKQASRVGAVPGSIIFKNGDEVARPLAGRDGDIACEGADGKLHDDANTFIYQKDGQIIEADLDDVKEVSFSGSKDMEADQEVTRLVLRQCITTEGPVDSIDDNGFCVPLGEPEANDIRKAMGAVVTTDMPLSKLLGDNC
jgi:hypothetical protein